MCNVYGISNGGKSCALLNGDGCVVCRPILQYNHKHTHVQGDDKRPGIPNDCATNTNRTILDPSKRRLNFPQNRLF